VDRLKTSLSRTEVSALLDLDPEVLDALLEKGRILCQYSRGEARIPLDQLESFFRDALVRLYRAEAGAVVGPISPISPLGPMGQIGPLGPITPPPEPEPEREPEPVVSAPLPPAPPPPEELPPELRRAERYVPLRQIGGIFGETKFSILQMSTTGLRIRHQESLMPGTEAKVSFALLRPARSVVVRARVVWTSIARSGEERFSISGLRILDHQERVARAIDLLKAAHELQPERRTQVRRTTDGLIPVEEISDDEIALVTNAVQKFATDPVEAGRWYSRARFALSDENVRRAAPERPREREEVLGIWEYLDRQVEIPKIAGIVGWIRQAG
jgi:PilZ domain